MAPPKKRSVTGCLTCRKRRKKCDERKPVCTGCESNFLQCTWPDYNGGRVRRKRGCASANQPPVLGTPALTFQVVEGPAPSRAVRTPRTNGGAILPFECYSTSASGALTKYDSAKKKFIESRGFTPDPLETLSSAESSVETSTLLALQFGKSVSEKPPVLDKRVSDPILEQRQRLTSREADLGNFDPISSHRSELHDDSADTISYDLFHNMRVASLLDIHLTDSTAQVINVPTDALVLHHSTQNYQKNASPQEYQYFDKLLQGYKKGHIASDKDFDNIDMMEFLFYVCAKGFIPKLDTHYTHPSLTTDATFIPQVNKNSLMRNVFICCGATYLAWCDLERFQQLSDELYIDCKAQILDYIQRTKNFADEDWLLASLQLLCIRDKNSFTGTVDGCIWHLSQSFLIIREKYYDYNPEMSPGDPLMEVLLRESIVLQPHERMFIESFIYHYSISILFARDISALPNPCALFKALSLVLKCPVYNIGGYNHWMNNPLLGLSLDAFEILAKLSYIARMPMPLAAPWLAKALTLRDLCTYYAAPAPPPHMNDTEMFNYKITSMVGLLVTKSCALFATKIINYERFDIDSPVVQTQIKSILTLLKQVPSDHRIWGILPWILLITGAFTRDADDQIFIIKKIEQMAHRAHSYCGLKMVSFLHAIWNSERGLDHLFERDSLAQVDL